MWRFFNNAAKFGKFLHKYNVLPGLSYLAPSRHWRFKVMSNDVKPLAYFTKVFYQVLLGIFSSCCHQTVQCLLVFLLRWLSSQQSGLLPQSRLMTLSLRRVFVQLRTERFTIMLLFMCEISPLGFSEVQLSLVNHFVWAWIDSLIFLSPFLYWISQLHISNKVTAINLNIFTTTLLNIFSMQQECIKLIKTYKTFIMVKNILF